MTTAMVLGKFMPPHAGHRCLVDFARHYADDVVVVVGTLPNEPIPGAKRVAWMRELFPDVTVVHLAEELPQYPEDHPDFWKLWRAALLRVLPHPPDIVCAGEPYGLRLADLFGAQFIPFYRDLNLSPSGTEMRSDPRTHWAHFPECVRPFFVQRICIFGPESTGKSTLTKRLAKAFETVAVPEYARAWLEPKGGKLAYDDLAVIARGQWASEQALARVANHLLFCDTDVLSTTIWSEVMFQRCSPTVRALAAQGEYALTFLLDVDVPYVDDSVRYLPKERASFVDRCKRALEEENREYVVLDGSHEARFQGAVREVRRRFSQTEASPCPP